MSKRRNFFESHNPVMSEKAYQSASAQAGPVSKGETMTVSGAVNKTILLGLLLTATAIWSYTVGSSALMWVGAIGGLIAVLVAVFKPNLSPILAPVYAGLEGLFVGGISAMYASLYSGIVFQAVTLTIALLFAMLFLYKSGLIVVTQRFRSGVMMATGAVFLVYLGSWLLSMFGISVPFLHDTGIVGIGISLVIIAIASLNLLLDFDNFEKGEEYNAPAYMEWFSAMGLIVTLVWLYVEVLRLLAIFSSND